MSKLQIIGLDRNLLIRYHAVMDEVNLKKFATLVRYFILVSTTAAGSGHPTTSLSATDLMVALFFKYLRKFIFNLINNLM